MIRLETVSEKTFSSVARLKVSPEQEQFVSSNLVSLAQAWLYYDFAKPFAIMDDDTVVGFMMLDWNEDERTVGVWRMMIGQDFQGRGYGRAAMEEAIRMIREAEKFDMIYLSYVPENTAAQKLYASCGFCETGEKIDDEIVMKLFLTDQPKVGYALVKEYNIEEIMEWTDKEKAKGKTLPPILSSAELLQTAVKNKQVKMFLIMGEVIGLCIDDEIVLSDEYAEYLEQAKEKVNA
ncbi:MAG TPA: GNAT family N-acetyltransferase [Bacillota bacterium]|nr:GNAT family N-acetyltransferase [Bacillota bacterium]HOK69087.1 GNAT family N-acetyltransferase [Bacillota bacterium]HPP84641.1 GNAT family N-acetyltransferase [Bacillota bacterium]